MPDIKTNVVQPEQGTRGDKRLLTLCWFKGEKDNQPKLDELSWGDFCKIFARHQISLSKLGGKAWSPVNYVEASTRANENVTHIHLAVVDVDRGENPDAVIQQLAGLAYLAHSSFSHTSETPKFRIILPLLKPVPATEWDKAWATINHWLGGINDPSTKDQSRIYFCPARAKDAANHFVKVGEGKWLDISTLPEPLDSHPNVIKKPSTAVANVKHVHIDGIDETPDLSPEQGLVEMVNRCAFMQWASAPENQPSVSNPAWMAMVSNACRFEGGSDWIHEASCHYADYDEGQTGGLIARCFHKYAPFTCERIQGLGFEGCPSGGCPIRNGEPTKAPAGLVSWIYKPLKVAEPVATSTGTALVDASKTQRMPTRLNNFIAARFSGGLVFTNQTFYGYTQGYFKFLDETAGVAHQVFDYWSETASEEEIEKMSSRKIEEMVRMLKIIYARDIKEMTPNKSLICLSNGTLDTDTYELLEHSPVHRLMVKTNIDWIPDATCPRWLQFLDEVFQFDIDKDQKIAFMQEWFGYCLVPDSSMHKFLWLVGAGGNGKSVVLKILASLVGEDNVSAANVERLDSAYVRAELVGKLVNVSAEMKAEATLADGYLKGIVGGDLIDAERKFEKPFKFTPYVRMMAATNHLPQLLDLSKGFFRRAIIISFNRDFEGANEDTQLEEKLLAELPGILVWALPGLKRLRERGQFDIPQSSYAVLAKYRMESDPVALFVDEALDLSDTIRMSPGDIYAAYVAWAKINGYRQVHITNFGKRLAALGFKECRPGGKKYWLAKMKEGSTVWNWPSPPAQVSVTPLVSKYSID